MKLTTAILAAALGTTATAQTMQIVGPAQPPVHSVDSRDIDRLDARIDDIRTSPNGTAGAAAMGAIDFVRDRPAIGFGVSRWEGVTGWAVKGMVPFSDRVHGSVSAFGAGGDVGAAGAFVIGF